MAIVITTDQIDETVNNIKLKGERLILVGGCFDILHPGHVEFLSKAKKLGGSLLVLLESDETVKRLKGDSRPVHTQKDRALVLSHLRPIDVIILLSEIRSDKDYDKLITMISPDFIAITKDDPVKKYAILQAQKIHAQIVEVIERKPHATSSITKRLNI